jgi:hypothetical protein
MFLSPLVDVFFPLSVCFFPPTGARYNVPAAYSSDDKYLLFKYKYQQQLRC